MMEKKKMKRWKKVVLSLVCVVIALVVIAGIAVGVTWGNEISTAASIEKLRDRDDSHLDGSVYRMDVKGGFYFDKYLEEGGASTDAELISFITDNITKGLIDMGIKESNIGCASFTAQTEDGDQLFARNYDFAKTNTCLVFTDPGDGRHASISTVDLQFLGIDTDADVEGLMDRITCLAAPYAPLDGMNDAGVSCGIYMSYQGGGVDEEGDEVVIPTNQDTDKPDLTSTTMLRLVLDYAGSVDEAVELISGYDLHDSANTSYHYMIADSTGKSAILEWVDGTDQTDNDGSSRQLVVTYNDSDANIGPEEAAADYQWITNFIIQPGYYADDSEKAGLDRYDHIYGCLSATDGVVADEDAAMDILAQVGRRTWNNDDGNGCTVHSVIYNLTDKTVLWVPNEHYDEEDAIYEFAL
ncbi:MAG TPA: linear amide C-N hydrolase [Candidatus Pullilachnospira gallistercoris]|uniref:Linear amide C-N hydrolase n=1 Tax=Candidatus Pullilachnospira gallistercoris TaxID=2840911 RepID=A0A9D1E810_9FIRM|nr:linear amide C-N hydrolase [Candidatus Pullilachnospira gallistercoris]